MIAKIKNTIISLALVMVAAFGVSSFVTAPTAYAGDESRTGASGGGDCGASGITFFPAWYKGLCNDKGDIKSPNDMGGDTATQLSRWLTRIAINIVEMLLYVVGYVSFGFIIYGGFKYMISGDTASGTTAARKTITNAVIGLILSIMSVALVNLVTGAIVA